MNKQNLLHNRRFFVRSLTMGAAFFSVRGLFAEELVRTPRQTEGPFYPDRLPLDTDNDLLIINDGITPAVGEITWLSGQIMDENGRPIRNAMVEIWQCDNNGVYLHSKSGNKEKRDPNFQGFGRFLTGSSGEYQFRTIKPVPYARRTAHIHYAIKVKGQERFTTQCYIQGYPDNANDFVYNAIPDAKERASVSVPFVPIKDSHMGELAAHFDIVLGITPRG